MKITVKQDSPFVVALEGRLDTTTAPQLDEYISSMDKEDWKDVTIDMSECGFVSSAGLRVIVVMQKRAVANDGKLVFSDVAPEVMDVFKMTGFDKILTFSKSADNE